MSGDARPQADPVSASMATLRIRKVRRRVLGLGGAGHWEVAGADGHQVATATDRLGRHELHVESGRERVTARIPAGMMRLAAPKELEVVDDATGRPLIDGRLTSVDLRGGTFHAEEWALTLTSGGTIAWAFTLIGDRKLGFFEPGGPALMTLGHDPSFDASERRTTLGILLRFWSAAAASVDRYLAHTDVAALGRLVPAERIPMLAMLGVWLERTSGGRYASQTSGGGMD